jgi:hypothetical protein
MMRALIEMAYEFDEPFVLDTTKYESVFGGACTPLPIAIAATVDGYRSKALETPAPLTTQLHTTADGEASRG